MSYILGRPVRRRPVGKRPAEFNQLTPEQQRVVDDAVAEMPPHHQDRAYRDVVNWLVMGARVHDGARFVEADALARLAKIPKADRTPEWTDLGWRFGLLTSAGLLASPWVDIPWPRQGLRALCIPSSGHAGRTVLRASDSPRGCRVYAEHTGEAPVRDCRCGLYSCDDLDSLVDRLSRRSDAAQAYARDIGATLGAVPLWSNVKAVDVFVQVEGWGNSYRDNRDYGPDRRFAYMRVARGGRAYIHPSKADLAAALAERYGLGEVIRLSGKSRQGWLDAVRDHHEGEVSPGAPAP